MLGAYVTYLDIGKETKAIIMRENLTTKITMSNLQIPLCTHYGIKKGSQKYGQRPGENC